MSGRQFRKVLLLAVALGVAYWIYKDRPTVSGFIDSITDPVMGSRAAVKSSERNRVVGDASAAITEQSDLPVGSLREGMAAREVVDLLGEPDSRDDEVVDGAAQVRWTYARAHRVLYFQRGRLVSIVVR
jgi:hypothetical protein